MSDNNTGSIPYACDVCDWVYDENLGDPDGGVDPGTAWEDIPEDWVCPICGAGKDDFAQIIRKQSQEPLSGSDFYLAQWERKGDDREPEFRTILDKALTGHEQISAMRTPRWKNLFEEIVFLPGQLAHRPLDGHSFSPDLSVVIGPDAQSPLHLDLPYYISDMSFGSLSREAKVALAKGSAAVGTAIFGGEGGLLTEEHQAAHRYIFEYSTGRFGASEENLKSCAGIQIKIGQAAKAGLGGHLLAAKVTQEIATARGVVAGEDLISPANHADITSPEQLKEKVAWLRQVGGGVPVGVKIAAGQVEADLAVALEAEVDFITLDTRGGSTGAAPNHIKDNVCIPAPFALARARHYLDRASPERRVSLLVTGGFRSSGDLAKSLAMGADAVGLATAAMIGIGCQQYRVCHKGTCPVGIATQNPELRQRFDSDKSAAMLTNLLTVYRAELADFVRVCGKERIGALSQEDLAALTQETAHGTGLSFAGLGIGAK
jgi:methylamine---glutamate N-methyltransferase subunit C